jgi:hypothetical protein
MNNKRNINNEYKVTKKIKYIYNNKQLNIIKQKTDNEIDNEIEYIYDVCMFFLKNNIDKFKIHHIRISKQSINVFGTDNIDKIIVEIYNKNNYICCILSKYISNDLYNIKFSIEPIEPINQESVDICVNNNYKIMIAKILLTLKKVKN